MEDRERMEELLRRQTYMVIAVVLNDGTPWAVPVKVQERDKNIFEWDSKLDTLHSKAIEQNPSMAITIFEKLDDTQTGLYALGKAELVTSEGDYGRYRFVVDRAWLNDETFSKRDIVLG